MSIDLETLQLMGASTLAPDEAETASAEHALFARPELARAARSRPRAIGRQRAAVLVLALVGLASVFAVPAFGVQQRVHDLFYGSPAPKGVDDALAHTAGFKALPAQGVIEAESSKGPMKLYYAGATDPSSDGCLVQDVPYGVGGTTCGPSKDWFKLALVGGLQTGQDDAGHSFTFASGRFNPPAVSARFVYAADRVVPLPSYRGWFIAEPDPSRALIALEAIDANGAVVDRQPMSDLTRDQFDPKTLTPDGPVRPLVTIRYAGHSNAALSIGRTKAGTDGAWLTIDGERQSEYSHTIDGMSIIQAWSYPGLSFLHGYARPEATHATISYEDGTTDNVPLVQHFFFYRVMPDHLKPGHLPTSFKILDVNDHTLDQMTQPRILELLP